MRANTITTMTRRRRRARRRVIALAVGVCALAIPASAVAQPIDSEHKSATTSLLNSPASEPTASGGLSGVDADYSSVNAIAGSEAGEPTPVSSLAASPADGFDWSDAVMGAGATVALVALAGGAILTVRRRTTMSPSASTG